MSPLWLLLLKYIFKDRVELDQTKPKQWQTFASAEKARIYASTLLNGIEFITVAISIED